MDKIFANGIIFKEPSGNAPDFVKGSISIKKPEFIPFLEGQDGDWVNLSIKESKAGKIYIELDTWKPDKTNVVDKIVPPIKESDNSGLPF